MPSQALPPAMQENALFPTVLSMKYPVKMLVLQSWQVKMICQSISNLCPLTMNEVGCLFVHVDFIYIAFLFVCFCYLSIHSLCPYFFWVDFRILLISRVSLILGTLSLLIVCELFAFSYICLCLQSAFCLFCQVEVFNFCVQRIFSFIIFGFCCCTVVKLCPILCDPMDCSMPGFPITNSQSLLKLMSIESVMPSNHLILCRPLLLPPSIFSSIRVFSSESVLPIRWPNSAKFRFQFQHQSFQWIFRTISFRMDWLDLAVQGTLKSLLQHHSSKASILWCSAFFIVQLSHPYMTTGKTTALTGRTFVGKVMSLLF